MKKRVILLFTFVFCLIVNTSVFADNYKTYASTDSEANPLITPRDLTAVSEKGNPSDNSDNEALSLNINQCINLLLAQNEDLKRIYTDWDLQRRELEKVSSQANRIFVQDRNLITSRRILMKCKEADLKLVTGQRSVLKKEQEMISKLIRSYYDIINLEDAISLQDMVIRKARMDLDNAKLRFDLNLVDSSVVEAAEMNLDKMIQQQDQNYNNLKLLKRNLCIMLGIDENQDISLVRETLSIPEVNLLSVDDYIKKALENRVDYKIQLDKIEILKIGYQIEVDQYGSHVTSAVDIKEQIDAEQYNLDTLKKTIDNQVRKSYDNLISLKDTCKNASRSREKAEKDFEIEKLKYDLGMVTESSLLSAEITLDQQKLAEQQAITDYICAIRDFESYYQY